MTIRILVTGSRYIDAVSERLVRDVLNGVLMEIDKPYALGSGDVRPDVVIVHGGARGVDSVAENWTINRHPHGITAERHSAEWDEYGKRAGMVRNGQMVSLGAHLCLAFPRKVSPGTWNCIYQAVSAGIITRIYPLPDMS